MSLINVGLEAKPQDEWITDGYTEQRTGDDTLIVNDETEDKLETKLMIPNGATEHDESK